MNELAGFVVIILLAMIGAITVGLILGQLVADLINGRDVKRASREREARRRLFAEEVARLERGL